MDPFSRDEWIVLACSTFTQQRWFYLLIAKVFLVLTKMISLKACPVVMVGLSVSVHGSIERMPRGQKVDSGCLGSLIPPDLFSSVTSRNRIEIH